MAIRAKKKIKVDPIGAAINDLAVQSAASAALVARVIRELRDEIHLGWPFLADHFDRLTKAINSVAKTMDFAELPSLVAHAYANDEDFGKAVGEISVAKVIQASAEELVKRFSGPVDLELRRIATSMNFETLIKDGVEKIVERVALSVNIGGDAFENAIRKALQKKVQG